MLRIKNLSSKLKLDTIYFYGKKPLGEMPKYYAMADAMIVTMKDMNNLSMTLPGKIQSYLAAGKPILGAINGEARRVIDEAKCGICVPAEDYKALAEVVHYFCENFTNKQYGENAIKYYNENFSKSIILKKLVEELNFF